MTYSGKIFLIKDQPAYKIDMSLGVMWFRKCNVLEDKIIISRTFIHRDDGPAIIFKDKSVMWFWLDMRISQESWILKVRENEEYYDDVSLALLYLKYL